MIASLILIGLAFFSGVWMTNSDHPALVRAFGTALVIASGVGFVFWAFA